MTIRKAILLAIFLCLALQIGAAKSTKLITSWKNPQSTTGHFKKILVIGVSARPGRRADFEDALSQSLAKPGIEVVPGNSILLRPDTSPIDLDYLRTQIRDFKIDAVVLSRLVSVKESVTYVPPEVAFPYPYYGSFYGYYRTITPVVYSPGYLIEDKTVRIETNVYGITAADGELVWTGTSDTFNPKDVQKAIHSVVKVVTKQLKKDGIF